MGAICPQEFRHRIDTPTLRGVNVQRLFGSQRVLKTVEDFTEFEQRGAYFDGDQCMAAKKGVNVQERGSQVHFMAEFMALLDFPTAPKLNIYGKLDSTEAGASELRGENLFNGKALCIACHSPPYYRSGCFSAHLIGSIISGRSPNPSLQSRVILHRHRKEHRVYFAT